MGTQDVKGQRPGTEQRRFTRAVLKDILALEALIKGDERILAEPAPVIAVAELADSSVNFVVRPWVKSGDYWAVQWEFLEAVKTGDPVTIHEDGTVEVG